MYVCRHTGSSVRLCRQTGSSVCVCVLGVNGGCQAHAPVREDQQSEHEEWGAGVSNHHAGCAAAADMGAASATALGPAHSGHKHPPPGPALVLPPSTSCCEQLQCHRRLVSCSR